MINPNDNIRHLGDLSDRIKHLSDAGRNQEVDNHKSAAHHVEMNSVSKEVLDARLETIETRMDGRLANMETKMDVKFAELKSEMHKGTAELVKWVVGTAIAMAAVAITVMTFVLNNAVPKAPTTPAPPPAPIIIYAQPAQAPTTLPQPNTAPNKP